MYIIFEKLKEGFKVRHLAIDNCTFRLHYKFTSPLLLVFSVLLTAEKILEDPIKCMKTDHIPTDLLNAFCWVHPTFSVVESWNKEVGEEVPYPGVDKYLPGKDRVFHAYYQWVGMALFFQSISFYVPHYVWKTIEGNKIKYLTENLVNPIARKKDVVEDLANYLVDSRNQHRWYYAGLLFAEILNLVNVGGQIVLMDAFFLGRFNSLGKVVAEFTNWDHSISVNPLVKLFPRVAKCTFYQYGPSGGVQRHETVCVLPLNIYNEKVYVFLWFWFLLLVSLSAFVVAYRVLLSLFRSFRLFIFRQSLCLIERTKAEVVMEKTEVGDWLVLDLLRRNTDPVRYRAVIDRLYTLLNDKSFHSPL